MIPQYEDIQLPKDAKTTDWIHEFLKSYSKWMILQSYSSDMDLEDDIVIVKIDPSEVKNLN